MLELVQLTSPAAGPVESLLLWLVVAVLLWEPLADAAGVVAACGRGGLSRSRKTLSKTLSGGRGGAVLSPLHSHQSEPEQHHGMQSSTSQSYKPPWFLKTMSTSLYNSVMLSLMTACALGI